MRARLAVDAQRAKEGAIWARQHSTAQHESAGSTGRAARSSHPHRSLPALTRSAACVLRLLRAAVCVGFAERSSRRPDSTPTTTPSSRRWGLLLTPSHSCCCAERTPHHRTVLNLSLHRTAPPLPLSPLLPSRPARLPPRSMSALSAKAKPFTFNPAAKSFVFGATAAPKPKPAPQVSSSSAARRAESGSSAAAEMMQTLTRDRCVVL